MSIPQPEKPEFSEDGSAEHTPVPTGDRNDSGRPLGVLVIALILVLEALTLLAAAAWYGYELITSTPASYGGALFTLALLLALAAWLLAVGHFLFRGHRWTRSAALVWQLLLLAIAVPTLTGGYLLYGWALLIPAAVVIILLFTKPVVAFTTRTANPPAAF